MRFLSDTEDELTRYLTNDRWFQLKGSSPLRLVGYFSPEFGISEALPQYSGGLGVLAGDHLKASSDLGVPLVGVGLFYRHGYFRQSLSHDGWQQERYPDLDPYAMALTLCEGVRVNVDLAGRPLHAQVWRADVGRTPLYLLDADIDDNEPDMREVTDRLYGGDVEHRLQQEILLGMGGVRMLEALGLDVQVFHTNEGHAGFLGLERMHRLITKEGLSFAEAIEAVRASSLFTTHTPVPAGIDRFPKALMERYFTTWATECKVSLDALLGLGRRDDEPSDDRFNMAVMGLRLAARSNAVAKLHGEVSRQMFAGLWPDVPVAETPITSVTNGVHAPTWVAPEMADVFSRYVSPGWTEASAGEWERIDDVSDDELWRAREHRRGRLALHIRARLRATGLARGQSPSERRVVRQRARPEGADDRLRPPLRDLQACDAAALAARPLAQPAVVVRAGAVRVRRQGAPRRRSRQGTDPRPPPLRGRPDGAPSLRVRRRLRHRARAVHVPRVRRLAEQPAAAAGSVRHERHEGRDERRAQLLDPRRLVGRVASTARTAGRSRRRRARPTSRAATRSRRTACSSCSSIRSCRSTTSAPRARRRVGGSAG